MHAILIQVQGSPVAPNIAFTNNHPEPPSPPPGHAVVKTLCSALNHMDIWVGMGIPGVDLTYPRISGCDACGIVQSVADDCDPAWVGRTVIINAAYPAHETHRPDDPTNFHLATNYRLTGEHDHGMHAERFTCRTTQLVNIDPDTDPVEAAAFGLVTLTAYSMMITKGNLRPGQSVLITGIGGGVALAALDLARWMGCQTFVTSRHQHKLDRAKQLGATHTILDQGQDWSKDIRKLTNKRGVDMAVDSIGKPTHLNCIKSLARGGAFVTPGNTGGPRIESDQARIFWNQLRVLGSTMGTTDELRECAALVRAGHLTPAVDSLFTPTQAQQAWHRLESQEQFGKIVIDWR